MLHPRWLQLLRTVLVFTLTGWACAVAVTITDNDTPFVRSVLGAPAIRAGVLGIAVGLPWAPLAAWPHATGWRRAGQGALAGTLAGLLGVVVYFWLWPPEWNAGTMATLKVFYKTYGLRVGPLSTLGGILAAGWASQVAVQPPTLAGEG